MWQSSLISGNKFWMRCGVKEAEWRGIFFFGVAITLVSLPLTLKNSGRCSCHQHFRQSKWLLTIGTQMTLWINSNEMTRCQQCSARSVKGGRKWKKKREIIISRTPLSYRRSWPEKEGWPGLEKFWFPAEKGNLQPQGKRAKPFLPPWTPLVVSVKADLLEPALLLRSRTASQDNRGWAAGYRLWLTRVLPQLPGHCQQKQTHDTKVHHRLFCSQAVVPTLVRGRRLLLL